MKKVLKKIVGVFSIAVVLLGSMFVWTNSAYAAASMVTSGTHGTDSVKWTLYSDGSLVISGSGHINIYQYKAPWTEYADIITSITIGSDVSYYGRISYQKYSSLKWIKNNSSEEYELGNSQTELFVDKNGNEVKSVSGGETVYRRLKPYGAQVTSTLDIQAGKQMEFYYIPVYFSFITDKAGVGSVKDFVFTSSDESVLTVDENGIMTAKKTGTVTVTVTARYDTSSWCMGNVATTVNVKEAADLQFIIHDNIIYRLNSDGTAALVDGRKCSANFTIPNTIKHNNKSYSVTHIEKKAFSECTWLETVKLPDSLINIGEDAFEYCSSLENVVLPNKLQKIEMGGFYHCSQISSIDFPASLTFVGQNAFLGTALKSIYIPKTLTSFNYLALSETYELESITVEEGHPKCKSIDGVLYIMDQYGYGLAKYPTARKGEVYEIDSNAGCVYLCAIEETKYLKKIIFPANMEGNKISIIQSTGGNSSVEEFGVVNNSKYLMAKDGVIYSKDGKHLYLYPPAKKDKVFTVPSGVEYMKAIGELQYLEEIYIPASVKTIQGIKYLYNLKKVVFAKDCQITELPDSCFQGCEKLESICLPKSVGKFSDTWYGNEFFDCYNLQTLYVAKGSPLYSDATCGRQIFAGCRLLVVYGYGNNNAISQLASSMGKEYVNVVDVTDKVLGVTFNDTEITIKKGGSKNVNAFVYPENTTAKTLQYTSSNTKVATVSKDGTVKAVSTGTCYITAAATDGSGEYARCLVTVGPADGINKGADGKWYYYKDGKVNTSYTGMACNSYGWWYIKNGAIDFNFTGIASNSAGHWYMKNGKLDRTYTGMAYNAYGWWYMKDGKLDRTYTGMATNAYGTWYMKNGKLDITYTGMYYYNGSWIYVNKGKFDTTYTGMATNSYGHWYMKNGKLDRTYTGIAKNAYGSWYMKNGKLDRNFSGKLTINGKTYTIKNGKVM